MRMMHFLLFLLFLVPLNIQAAVEQPILNDKPDQINYSMGYHLGEQLLASGLKFNPDLLWQALNEGISGAEPQEVTEDYAMSFSLGQEILRHKLEFRAAALWQGLYDLIDQAQPRVTEVGMAQLLAELRGLPEASVEIKAPTTQSATPETLATPPQLFRLPGQKFLAENMAKEGVISLPSGLQYKIIKSGTGATSPTGNNKVLVNYEGKTITGQGFSGAGMLSETFFVNKLMPGLTQALKMMREGDRWEIYIPTRLGFKDVGPMAGKTIVYDLELVQILTDLQ